MARNQPDQPSFPSPEPESQEIHVTELAGPDDRWLSVTDASRVGRRQEHTIRTWIKTGVLPVHPERVGLNKRTRQVRLSDLARLTPIIDPEAAIATDLGTVDLPSIPKMQLEQLEQLQALDQRLTDLTAQQRQDAERLSSALDTQGERLQRFQGFLQEQEERLLRLLQDFTHHLAAAERHTNELHQEALAQITSLRTHLDAYRQQSEARAAELSEALARQSQQFTLVLTTQQRDQQQALDRVRADMTQLLQETAGQLRHESEALQLQQDQALLDLEQRIQGHIDQLSLELDTLRERFPQQLTDAIKGQEQRFGTRLEAIQITALGAQKRVDEQNQVIAQLRSTVLQEQQARQQQAKDFEQALQQERKQREALATHIQRLAKQKPRAGQDT